MKDIDKYADIIGLPHHQSSRHAHMSMTDRAAQFSPFAALTGFEEKIDETGQAHLQIMEKSDYIDEYYD